jgi:Icc-related predicted phosphoesterase
MRLLFGSDLHALRPAFEFFAKTLAEGPFDAGVLAGDLLDDLLLPESFLVRELGVRPDDLIEELPEADDPAPWKAAARGLDEINRRGLAVIEARLRAVLGRAGKPVFLVPGNHDETAWADGDGLVNLHGRRADFGGMNFVGYRWTIDHRSEAVMARDLAALASLVDRRTVLVTHAPPTGIMDGTRGRSYGIPALRTLVRERVPRWHLFGHVHSSCGRRGRYINGCYPHSMVFFDIDDKGRRVEKIAARVDVPEPRWA